MNPTPQFAPRRNCQVSRSRDTRRRDHRFDLDFRRALQRVPIRQRPGLCAWLRRYRRHRARTFHELDPATGHWRRL